MTEKEADQVALKLQAPRIKSSLNLSGNTPAKTVVKLCSVDSVQLEPIGVSAFIHTKRRGLVLWKNKVLTGNI